MANPFANRIVGYTVKKASELAANPLNYRKHPQSQREAVQASLRELGWIAAVVENVRTGYLVDGHERVWQAMKNDEDVPVLQVDLSEAEERLALATFDPITYMAETDAQALDALLREVNTGEAALQELLAGLAADAGLYANGDGEPVDAEPQIDRAEELRQKWGVQAGDLWQLGDHRLICGDCTDADVVARLMGGEAPDLVIADPPYGVNIVAANGSVGGDEGPNGMIPFGGVKKRRGYVGGGEAIKARTGLYPIQMRDKAKRLGSTNGAKPFGSKDVRGSDGAANVVDVGKYMPIVGDETTETALRSSAFYLERYPTAVQVWWGANYYVEGLGPSACWLVWDKETTGNFADCELAWVNQDRSAKLFRHQWNGMLRDSERERRWHPTQKPAALAAWVCELFTEPDGIVVDPFAGAGWAVLGGETTGRKVRAIEVSEDYCAVALQRWADATGREPSLIRRTDD